MITLKTSEDESAVLSFNMPFTNLWKRKLHPIRRGGMDGCVMRYFDQVYVSQRSCNHSEDMLLPFCRAFGEASLELLSS